MEDYIGWIFLFIMLCGGGIAAGWSQLMAALGGRGPKGLSRKQVKQLQAERDEAYAVLRELQAWDKYAAYPLNQELSDKVNEVLGTKKTPQIEKRQDT